MPCLYFYNRRMVTLKWAFCGKPGFSSLLPSWRRMEAIHLSARVELLVSAEVFIYYCALLADMSGFGVDRFFPDTYSLQNYLRSSCSKASRPQNNCWSHFHVPRRFLGVHMRDFSGSTGGLTALDCWHS